jgi:hypothetical protein
LVFSRQSVSLPEQSCCGLGELVSDDELKRRLAEAAADPGGPYIDTITVEHDLHLVIPPGRVHYGNPSCDPNLWYMDAYSFSARHDIEPGQELTNDNATTTRVPGREMDCLCGSLLCRRRVTGRDWTSPDPQDRYGISLDAGAAPTHRWRIAAPPERTVRHWDGRTDEFASNRES